MARLAPQVRALRARFGRQPERFSSELAALYKREGASPFAGFLPLLAQWPFLSVMYLLFRSATVDGTPNQLLSMSLFDVPLGAHWLSGAGLLSVHDVLFLAVFAVLTALCWLSARLAAAHRPRRTARGRRADRGPGGPPRDPGAIGRRAGRAIPRRDGAGGRRQAGRRRGSGQHPR